jgi:hypothetical protein
MSLKWFRQDDDRHSTWILAAEQWDEGLASVQPVWDGIARMSQAPTGWQSFAGNNTYLGTYRAVKEAKAAAKAALQNRSAAAQNNT